MVTSTFTPESAQSFHRYSPINAATVKMRLACGCEPYKDVFTYNRWLALGYQVQRGERSIKIPVIVGSNPLSRIYSFLTLHSCQTSRDTERWFQSPFEDLFFSYKYRRSPIKSKYGGSSNPLSRIYSFLTGIYTYTRTD